MGWMGDSRQRVNCAPRDRLYLLLLLPIALRRPSHFLLIPPYSFSHWMRSWICWTVNRTRNASVSSPPIGGIVTSTHTHTQLSLTRTVRPP
jgi:hypothetical protein